MAFTVNANIPMLKTNAAMQWPSTTRRICRARYRDVGGLEGHAEREGEIEEIPIAGFMHPGTSIRPGRGPPSADNRDAHSGA